MIVLDFETFYAKDFTLSKLTTEEYVRDPRFHVIGCGIKVGTDPARWYPQPEVRAALEALSLHEHPVLAHNAMFDGFILSEHYGLHPGMWLDTLSMARAMHGLTVRNSLGALAKHYGLPDKGDEVVNALGFKYTDFTPEHLARYGRYCCNDVEIAALLFECLMRAGFPTPELASIDQTIRMFTEPMIELDLQLLEHHLATEQARKQQLLHTVLGGEPTEAKLKELRSNEKFAKRLMELGVSPPQKISPTTGKLTYAFAKTDAAMQALAESEIEPVALLAQARLGVKSSIEETRAERLIGVAKRGPLPVDLSFYGAHTGRYTGGSKLNIQNLPSRGSSTALRRALKAPEGYVFVSADSSQIEARIVGWLAGQDDLTQAFAEGRDVYCEFAGEVYGGTVTKADKDERFVGKTGILSLGYGAGGARFKDMLRTQGGVIMEHGEADNVVNLYRRRYPRIPKLWRMANEMLRDMIDGYSGRFRDLLDYDPKGIVLPSGFRIQYPGLTTDEDGREMYYLPNPQAMQAFVKAKMTGKQADAEAVTWVKIYGGKCIENIVQALAAVIIRWQARLMAKRGYHLTFQVHDDLVFLVRAEEASDCAVALKQAMSRRPKWAPGLPLACEVKVGETYGGARVVG